MAKCALTGQEADWAWQPFGPEETPRTAFALLGSHYRGFPVIKVSDAAKAQIQSDEITRFKYKGVEYRLHKNTIEISS